MAYTTEADIKKRLTERRVNSLTSDSGLDYIGSVVADCIGEASDEIDAYLYGVVVTPLVGVIPPIIKIIATDIAIYYLYLRRVEPDVPEQIRAMYDRRKLDLEKIRSGDLLLKIEDSITHENPQSKVITNKRTQVFSADFYRCY